MLKKLLGFGCIILITSFNKPIISDYEIAAFYKAVTLADGSKVLTSGDDLEDIELLLSPITISTFNPVDKIVEILEQANKEKNEKNAR